MRTLGPRAALARRQPLRRFAANGPAALVVRNLPRVATAAGMRRALATATIETAEPEVARDDAHGATVRGRKIAVELASDAGPARKPATTQPQHPGGKAAAIALNKQLFSSEAAGDVLSLFEDKSDDFNYVNFATSLHRLGILSRSLEKSSRPLLQKLVDRATSSIIDEMNEWESRELSNACWGVAKIGNVEAPALFEAVAAQSRKKIATFNSQALANTAWAYATAGVEAPALFKAVAAESSKKIVTFNSQNLAKTVWAYSTLGVEAPALFEAVAAEAPKRIATFDPQALANTVWAYATAGVAAPALFETVAAESLKKIAMFTPQPLAKIVWAYATAGFAAPALFKAVATEAPKEIEMFTPQALANTVWAYATAGVAAPALFKAVASEAPKKIATLNSQNLANTAWAYATAGIEAPALFEAVAAESSKKMATFNSQALANTVWAYAFAGVEAPALFEAVAAESSKKIATYSPQDLANTVWAYTTAGVEASALFEVIALSIEANISQFSPDGLSQLHQVHVYLRLEAPQHALTLVLSRHEAELRAAYLRQEPRARLRRSQRAVSAALNHIGWAHEFGYVTAEGIRLVMAQPASKVAVEFDGPTHYLAGASGDVSTRTRDGASKFKERLVRRLGWTVVRVPYFEWDYRSNAEREAYLRGKIKT